MNIAATKGGFTARLSSKPADIELAQQLRSTAFRAGVQSDQDEFDAQCQHLLVEDRQTGAVMACARIQVMRTPAEIARCYSAQRYDLQNLAALHVPMLELGRFCAAPHPKSTDILRTAWGHLTGLVDRSGIEVIFGCSSFQGAEVAIHQQVLAYLRNHHLGPAHLEILPSAEASVDLPNGPFHTRDALTQMPPLLRSYLAMGGWVSSHGVQDFDLDTLHVFTALQVADIPAARARALRAIAVSG